MRLVAAQSTSVVDQDTVIRFRQKGALVTGSYRGGRILAGYLIGKWHAGQLTFHYVQAADDETIDKGRSTCRVERLPDGRLRLEEQFVWESREGSGTNIFEEI